nr:MAG TPA: hypothetical protein [Caudoviricetes sp.]
MRLIDADKLKEVIEKEKGDNDYTCRLCMESTKEIIDEQPTVFDLDKVVKQLKDLKAMYWVSIANTGNEKLDVAYENVGNALDRGIEIVKGGGVE